MKKETVQKSHEMYKKKIEEKKLADEMIIHDIHLTPMILMQIVHFIIHILKSTV